MVVQHNLTAMNSNRMLNVTTGAQAKSTEKLSSGYKINRAADDAAGLSISEKMRRQIRGLTQASANAQDGISSVQTAEGALTEVHDMLQRMDELATKAANGTLSEDDRNNIQDEIDQLLTEVDRVSETTKFNETYLLKGNAEGTSSRVNVDAHDAGLAGKLVDNGNTATFKLNEALKNGDKVTIGGKEFNIVNSYSDNKLNSSTDGYAKSTVLDEKALSAGDSVTYKGSTYTLTNNIGWNDIKGVFGNTADTFKIGETSYTIVADNGTETDTALKKATALEKISAALAAGDDVKITKLTDTNVYNTGTDAVNLVQSLSDEQVSSYNKDLKTLGDTKAKSVAGVGSGGTVAVTLSEGDSVSIGGEVTTATTADPKSAKSVAADIEALDNGATVTIGTGDKQKVYTVADVSDESSGKLSKKDILSKIDHLEEVAINGGTASTVIGSTRGDTESLTATDAYKKMAEELKKASSIGADNEATVQNLGNGAFTIAKGNVVVKDGMSFDLHVGSDADMTNKITVNIDSMNAAGLGIKGLNVKGSDGSNATYAIDAIENAIKKVSSQRSSLGAAQNRLEHTIKNVDNVVENTTSAESSIRDTDMATEMVQYSKNNILAQAGQSMLAQANQSNQGVLSLLG